MQHPAVLLGEFDAQLGPHVSLVFECYADAHDEVRSRKNRCGDEDAALDRSAWVRQLDMLTGVVLLGRYIATGRLHPAYTSYASCIAARVLTAHETREESVLLQDTDGPAIGSFAFTLPDILARGEKRRFCLIFLHAEYEHLVRRWPVLTLLTHSIVASWTAALEARQRDEYNRFGDLERTRELARGRPLRPLPTMLSPINHTDDEAAVVRRLHCTFDCALALALGECRGRESVYGTLGDTVLNLITGDGGDQGKLLAAWRQRLQSCLPLAESLVHEVMIANDALPLTVVLQPHAASVALTTYVSLVKPLVAWLLEFAQVLDRPPECREAVMASLLRDGKLYDLLHTLFCGDQVIVIGDDALSCALFVIALADLLPPSLARFRVFAEEPVMPYIANIVSFSDAFMRSQQQYAEESEMRRKDMLWTRTAYGDVDALYVVLRCNSIVDIVHRTDVNSHEVDRPCTLISRILALLSPYYQYHEICPPMNRDSCERLTAQIGQLVREYVLRGTVYSTLYRRQEIKANESVLTHTPRTSTVSTQGRATSLFASLRYLFSRSAVTLPRAGCQARLANSAASAELRRCGTLRRPSGLAFDKERYVFLSSSSDDHAVLTFLGCAVTG